MKISKSTQIQSPLPIPWPVAVPSLPPGFHEIFDSSWFPLALTPASSGAVSLSPHTHSYSPTDTFLWFSPKRTHSHKASGGFGSFPREFKGSRVGGRRGMVHYTLLVILPALSLLSFPPSPRRPYSVFTVVIARSGSHRKHGLPRLSVRPLNTT